MPPRQPDLMAVDSGNAHTSTAAMKSAATQGRVDTLKAKLVAKAKAKTAVTTESTQLNSLSAMPRHDVEEHHDDTGPAVHKSLYQAHPEQQNLQDLGVGSAHDDHDYQNMIQKLRQEHDKLRSSLDQHDIAIKKLEASMAESEATRVKKLKGKDKLIEATAAELDKMKASSIAGAFMTASSIPDVSRKRRRLDLTTEGPGDSALGSKTHVIIDDQDLSSRSAERTYQDGEDAPSVRLSDGLHSEGSQVPEVQDDVNIEDQDLDDQEAIIIKGSYVEGGMIVTLTREELPRAIVEKAVDFIERATLKYADWRSKPEPRGCLERKLGGRTRFYFGEEKDLAACQTCTNLRTLCLRWYPGTPNVLNVVAIPEKVREGLEPASDDFWIFTRSGKKKNTPSAMWH